MTTMLACPQYMVADRCHLTKCEGSDVAYTHMAPKVIIGPSKTTAIMCAGIVLPESMVSYIDTYIPRIAQDNQKKHPYSTKLNIYMETLKSINFPSELVSILINHSVYVLTRENLYCLSGSVEHQSIHIKNLSNAPTVFGTGSDLLVAAMRLTSDWTTLFKLVSECDDLTSAEYDIVHATDLQPMKEVV